MGTTVIQHGLRPPVEWTADHEAEMLRTHRLWNTLVEIDRIEREQRQALVDSAVDVAPLVQAVAAAEAGKLALMEQRKRQRAATRTKQGTPALDAAIAAQSQALREQRVQVKAARAAARAALAAPLAALAAEHKEWVKRARQCSGCYWGNYNAVVGDYERARSKAIKEGAQLRFHPWRGEGRLTCQLQKGVDGENGATVAEVLDGRNTVVAVVDGMLRVRVTSELYAAFPVIAGQRALPEAARIKSVAVIRTRLGKRYRWHVSYTLSVPDEATAHASTHACGVNLNWRRIGETLRVAAWSGSDGEEGFVALPHALVRRFEELSSLQGTLDDLCAHAQGLVAVLPDEDMPPVMADAVQRLRRARHPVWQQVQRLWYLWREHSAWRSLECAQMGRLWGGSGVHHDGIWHLAEWIANSRQKYLDARLDLYRKVAADLGRRYAVIAMEDFDLREAAALESPEGEANVLHESARRQRQMVAPHELRKWLELQAVKRGGRAERYGVRSTRTCHVCRASVSAPPEQVVLSCAQCGSVYDRDINAARNLLAAAAGASGLVVKRTAQATATVSEGRFQRAKRRSQDGAASRPASQV